MIDPNVTLLSQFGNSPTIYQLIQAFNAWIDPRTNVDEFYDLVFNVDTAVGNGLDIAGRIVGVGRVLQIASTTFFGFQGPSGYSGLPWNQAPFYNGGSTTANYALTDSAYRVLILAKALANICNATIPAINQILINLFGPEGLLPVAGNSYCTDLGGMAMTYTFGAPLSPLQYAIVYQSGVLPKPAGVAATVVQL